MFAIPPLVTDEVIYFLAKTWDFRLPVYSRYTVEYRYSKGHSKSKREIVNFDYSCDITNGFRRKKGLWSSFENGTTCKNIECLGIWKNRHLTGEKFSWIDNGEFVGFFQIFPYKKLCTQIGKTRNLWFKKWWETVCWLAAISSEINEQIPPFMEFGFEWASTTK